MSVCRTISILASEVEGQLTDISESHRNLLSVMKEMPRYLSDSNLAEWEADYRNAISIDENEESNNYRAIDLIYEIAALNLFGEFEAEKTKEIYHMAISELRKMNINVTSNLSVDKW